MGQWKRFGGPRSDGGFAGRKRSSCLSGLRQFKRLNHLDDGEAIAGSRPAQRQVLKWIARREKWLAAKGARKHPSVKRLVEPRDPDNVDEALLILGIAEADNRWGETPGEPRRLLLQRWAVQLALSRGRRRLSANDISEIERCTRDAQTLRWPAGSKDEQERLRAATASRPSHRNSRRAGAAIREDVPQGGTIARPMMRSSAKR